MSKKNQLVFKGLTIVAWIIFVGLCIEAGALLVNFGSKAGRNGGFVLPIPKNADLNDFIVKVGQQYKWFSEDNTWIEFLPENGSIEISLVQISKSSQ